MSLWQRVRTFASLDFDRAQRDAMGTSGGGGGGGYAAFHVACAVALRRAETGAPSREVSRDATLAAFREGTPVMCAALQDVEGNMAGEGKLLNIYHSLQRTLDLGVEGDVVELGCHAGTTSALLAAALRCRTPPRNRAGSGRRSW